MTTLKLEDFEPVAALHVRGGKPFYTATISMLNKPPLGHMHCYTAAQMQQVIDQCNAKDAETCRKMIEDKAVIEAAPLTRENLEWLSGWNDLQEQLAAAQADNERLRDALNVIKLKSVSLADAQVTALEALATTSRTNALREHDQEVISKFLERSGQWVINEATLREHDAKLVDRLPFPAMLRKMWSGGDVKRWLQEQADKIRKGEF